MAGVAIVVFSDLVESTALLARLGDDRMDAIRRAHVRDVTDAVERGDGRLVKTLGDGAMACFESALDALRAAQAIQAAVERLDAEHGGIGVAARIGVAAGEPIADGDDLHGMTVVIASRLCSAAGSGEVLVQDVVGSLVASRDGVELDEGGEFELKGIPGPVRASRLLWRRLEPDAGQPPAGGESPGVEARDAGIRLPPALAAFTEEPLIGRDREIATLREQASARPGRRAVLIFGEPGIGKTRHAAAVAGEAHAAGATVALARCPPEAVVPFEPWVRAIGELALAGDEEWRESLARAAGPELAALVPELAGGAGAPEQVSAGEMVAAEGARYRLLRGIGSALGKAAGDGALQIVLDDAQWCDAASAQALAHLLESPPTGELVLVLTAREEELGRRHPVSRALSDLRRTGDLSELRLTGLDAAGLAAMVGARVGRAISPALAERLLDRTSGNPFFAGELARDLDQRGALREGEALEGAPMPEAVAELVEERLAQLEPATERLLTAAALIGPAAPVALAASAAGLDRAEAERAAGEALSERLVEDVAKPEPTIAFAHALVREALIAGAGDAERARFHLAIARALDEDPSSEPAELARHYGLCVELAGAERAIAAQQAAAVAAAEGHDHEQAAAHLRRVVALLPDDDLTTRASALLELGEQDLLSADLSRARDSYRAAAETARMIGDDATLARAALGFAGGDVGFGWELGGDDPTAVALLREGMEALGDEEPLLALRMAFRLVYLLVYTDEDETLAALSGRAEELGERLGDAEARLLASFTGIAARWGRSADPLDFPGQLADLERLLDLVSVAEECGREDLLFRLVQWSAYVHYTRAEIAQCERAIERGAEIGQRLGSPRFSWEVDLNRAMRLFDRGKPEDARTLLERAGAIVRRLRPDIHIFVGLYLTAYAEWIYDGETEVPRRVQEAMDTTMPRGAVKAGAMLFQALGGAPQIARRRIDAVLEADFEPVRHPDGHLPAALCLLAEAVAWVNDRGMGERLQPLLQPLRSYLIMAAPGLCGGWLPEWSIGRLELVADRPHAAVSELRGAAARADELELAWAGPCIRVDLARALRRGGDADAAESMLAEAEAMAAKRGVGWATRQARELRAEIERKPPEATKASERRRPIRALAARGGRRALAALVRDQDDAALERRFADLRRQRSLMRAMARGFQPAQAAGFKGTIAYELEPYATEPPPDAPWRWAIAVDADAGRARLVEPAPLDAATTVYFGLADWVRVVAGVEDPLAAMVAGRCSVEGDVGVAARLEAMFGAR